MTSLRTILALAGLVAAYAEVQHWSVADGNKTCLVMEAELSGQLHYTDGNETLTFDFKVNETLSTDGDCFAKYNGSAANVLKVNFLPTGSKASALTAQPWILTLTFNHPQSNESYQLANWALSVAPSQGFNETFELEKATDSAVDFTAGAIHGYKCSSVGLSFNGGSTVSLKSVRALPFVSLDTAEFPKEQVFEQCMLDSRTSDIVPIVVGACLAGLVVVVLVAYLIGRARAKRQGYASV